MKKIFLISMIVLLNFRTALGETQSVPKNISGEKENIKKDESSCQAPEQMKIILQFEEDYDKKLDIFASNKTIAQFSDEMLSKLIAAKSPMIRSWFAERQKLTETEMVLEWRKYFAQNFILQKYPQENAALNSEIEKFVDGFLKKYLPATEQKKFIKIFDKTKKAAFETIKAYALSPAIEKQLLNRLDQVQLYFPKNLKTAKNNSLPLDLIQWGIAYDPVANEINMGLRSLAYANEETIIAVFAHELGHVFDSCRWGAFFEGQWPFENVGQCLRSEKSVGALRRDDSKLEELVKKGKISADLKLGLLQNPTCNKLVYPPAGLQADQLVESFADWFSAEVVGQMKKIDFKKVRQELCDHDEKLSVGSSYVSSMKRYYRIYLAHPAFAKAMHQEKSTGLVYCSFSSSSESPSIKN